MEIVLLKALQELLDYKGNQFVLHETLSFKKGDAQNTFFQQLKYGGWRVQRKRGSRTKQPQAGNCQQECKVFGGSGVGEGLLRGPWNRQKEKEAEMCQVLLGKG